jgi:hypothetical protein
MKLKKKIVRKTQKDIGQLTKPVSDIGQTNFQSQIG